MKTKITAIIIFSLFFLGLARAQQNTTATGGDASGSGGSVSFSVGQIDHITATGIGGSAGQGVQQPYAFTTSKGDTKNPDIAITTFPNPATDLLVLNISSSTEATQIELHDALGKLLLQKAAISPQMQLDMKSYANGTYFLSVLKKDGLLKEFKIIKSVQ